MKSSTLFGLLVALSTGVAAAPHIARDQSPTPALTPGTGVPSPKPKGDHGSGDPVHVYHPGNPSSLPPPPGTGLPPPKPTGDIHHPGNPSPPPPYDGRPLSSIPPSPVPTGGQGSRKPIDVSGTNDHSTTPQPVAKTPRDANDVAPPPGTGIPKPVPTGPSTVPPPAPKVVKLPPITPVPNGQAHKDNAPTPGTGIPKPAPTYPSTVTPPVNNPSKDVNVALHAPGPVSLHNATPKDIAPGPTLHLADNVAVPSPAANAPNTPSPIPNNNAPKDTPAPGTGIPKPVSTDPSAIPPATPKDPKSPIAPSPAPINKAPNYIPPVPANGTPKPIPSSHPADSAPVPAPVPGTPKDAPTSKPPAAAPTTGGISK